MPGNVKDRWTPEEEARLVDIYMTGCCCDDIARQMGRSSRSVKAKVYRMGLGSRRVRSRPSDIDKYRKTDCMPNPLEWMTK